MACAGTSPEDTTFEVPLEVEDSTAAAEEVSSTSSPVTSSSSSLICLDPAPLSGISPRGGPVAGSQSCLPCHFELVEIV